jgi:pimeloyl-ACP methyl ester carboxylesterase
VDLDVDIRYARSGDLHIAYHVLGDGPQDLVLVPGFAWNVEVALENPVYAAFWRRVASFARLITIDKRGTGLSDRVPNAELPTLEERMDDLRAVLDALGSRQAALVGFWEGCPLCTVFAAAYPDRTRAVVLYAPLAAFRPSADYPWGLDDNAFATYVACLDTSWGTGQLTANLTPSLANDTPTLRWYRKLERQSASPGAAIALARMNRDIDVRSVLPAIRVPTLVLNRSQDPVVPLAAARYAADRIPGARFVELPGRDHLPWVGDSDAVVQALREFLTGARDESTVDRVLATILFVDIVGSTARAVELGDARWRTLLESFYAAARVEIDRFRGHQVNTTGDGILATFDGPARAIRCARAIATAAEQLGLTVRAGLHTGECEMRGSDVSGIAVHIGSRVADLAAGGEVLVSSTVRDLVAGSGITFDTRGQHQLRGVPGQWSVFAARA